MFETCCKSSDNKTASSKPAVVFTPGQSAQTALELKHGTVFRQEGNRETYLRTSNGLMNLNTFIPLQDEEIYSGLHGVKVGEVLGTLSLA